MKNYNALSQWRKELNYSQENMAKLIGVPRSTYVKWELESRQPSVPARSLIILMRWLSVAHPIAFQQIQASRVNK